MTPAKKKDSSDLVQEAEEKNKKIEIERTGEKIIVPESVTLRDAADTIMNQIKYEEENVEIRESIQGCFMDGIYAFSRAMQKKFGWVHAKPQMTWFGEIKPKLLSIASGPNDTVLVPWGRLTVPGISGVIDTAYEIKDGRLVFVIQATVQRKHEHVIRDLAKIAREILAESSLYRGKAVRISFTKPDGDPNPMFEPKFMEVGQLDPESLILNEAVEAAVTTSIFAPVQNSDACRKHGVPLKRGVLLSGPYGTGKTLAAYMMAKLCEDNGWTFIYCEKADELSDAVRFAHSYQPAAIFCEDIDRVLDGSRTIGMDEILNIIDGIESKNTEIMVILTTNHVENINKAMLRPGRLDSIIEFTRPNAGTVERLLRFYGKGLIDEDEDLTAASHVLAGQIPAVIRECVERAKLSAIKLGFDDELVITGEAIKDAANGMEGQLKLMSAPPKTYSRADMLEASLAGIIASTMQYDYDDAHNRVNEMVQASAPQS